MTRYPEFGFEDLGLAAMLRKTVIEAGIWEEGSPEQVLCIGQHLTIILNRWHADLMAISPSELGRANERVERAP